MRNKIADARESLGMVRQLREDVDRLRGEVEERAAHPIASFHFFTRPLSITPSRLPPAQAEPRTAQ